MAWPTDDLSWATFSKFQKISKTTCIVDYPQKSCHKWNTVHSEEPPHPILCHHAGVRMDMRRALEHDRHGAGPGSVDPVGMAGIQPRINSIQRSRGLLPHFYDIPTKRHGAPRSANSPPPFSNYDFRQTTRSNPPCESAKKPECAPSRAIPQSSLVSLGAGRQTGCL